jgi:thiamine-phosphate pyrophosphorylase
MTLTPLPRNGLYVITDTRACEQFGVVECVRRAIAGGARLVQYRDKVLEPRHRQREATELLALCRQNGVPLIINDDLALAVQIGADGVHVGRDDGTIAEAREALGPRGIVGASCYHEYNLAEAAHAAGASYVAFGRFFNSRTKPGQPLATPQLLQRAHRQLGLPVAAIGGIDAGNAASLIEAGADLLACIHSVVAQADITAAARSIQRLFPAGPGD